MDEPQIIIRMQDAEDVAIYDARKAALAPLPADLSAIIPASDSFLQALRKWRGKTQVAVAEAVGIQQGYLSDLESGRRHGLRTRSSVWRGCWTCPWTGSRAEPGGPCSGGHVRAGRREPSRLRQ